MRERGQRCFEQGRIALRESADEGHWATARGSSAAAYMLRLEPEPGEDPFFVRSSCTCPHYQRGDFCKHLWAFVLALDEAFDEPAVPGEGELVLQHELDRDDPEFEDEFEDFYEEPAGTSAAPGATRLRPHTVAPRAWRQLFAQARSSPLPGRSLDPHGQLAPAREAWFVINPEQSRQCSGLVVDFYHRQCKKDGQLGTVKREGVNEDTLWRFSDAEDRRLLGLMLGTTAPEPNYAASWMPYERFSTSNGRRIAPALYELLLPALAATGRLVWPRAGIGNTRTYEPVAWDDGEPWCFRVRARAVPEKDRYELEGEFYRGSAQALDTASALLVLDDGLLLTDGRLARLDIDAQIEAVNAFAQAQKFTVPYKDREQFMLSWWSMPERPEAELPAELSIETRKLSPRGHVQIESPVRHRFHSHPDAKVFVAFDYEGQSVDASTVENALIDLNAGSLIERDRDAEAALLEQLQALGVRATTGGYGSPVEYKISLRRAPFLMRELLERGWLVESEGARVREPGELAMEITSGIDWFDLNAEVDYGGVSVSLPELLEAANAGESVYTLQDGSQGLIPADLLSKYARFSAIGEQHDGRLRFSVHQTLLLDALLEERAAQTKTDAQFDAWRERLAGFERIDPLSEPKTFKGTLRPYQRDGLAWLRFLDELGVGGCLADDMGLGKTVQVLALLESWRTAKNRPDFAQAPSLVVVPRSLVHNWVNEAGRFTPRLRVIDYTGAQRGELLPRFADADLIIMTYGTLRRDITKLKDLRFHYAMLDEAQAIKNPRSQAAKACRLLRAHRRLTITGTPVENHLGELWSLFEFLNPGLLGRATAFESATKPGASSSADTAQVLASGLRPFILRRTKEQVLDDLPDKTEQTLVCELGPKQRKLYDELRDYYRALIDDRISDVGLGRSKIHVLEALLRLRQAACHPGLVNPQRAGEASSKLDSLLESLTEVAAEGHKALVFSQFTSFLALVREKLDRTGMTYEYLDGSTRDRERRVERFQTDADCPLFLISLKAGGQGLNLTAADYVFILDPWWNPAVEAQAVDRAHRIGQSRHVFAYRLIARDTVEEKIVELKQKKQELADAVITADESLIRSLTREDLALLLE
ncbi:MAG: SNF2-related protein [Gammaproteobacteria bacterium]